MSKRIDPAKWYGRLAYLRLKRLPAHPRLTTAIVEAIRTHATGERFTLADGRPPGFALSVYPDGSASYILQGRTRAGRAVCCGLGSAAEVTLEDARAEAERLRAELKAGRDPVAERREKRAETQAAEASTVRRYLLGTYDPKVLVHKKSGTATKDRILASWKVLLDVPISHLTRGQLEEHLAARKAETKEDGSRKLANATLNREWAVFRAMLADAVRRGQLAAIPVQGKPEPLRGLREEPRIRWLGENDIEGEKGEKARFFDALDAWQSHEMGGGTFLRSVVRIGINTGMRRGEIIRLTDAMVKLNEARIDLPAAVCKSGKGRAVYLNPDAIAALRKWLEVRKTLKLQTMDGALFPGEPQRWCDRISQREFPELCRVAGVENFVFHCLRHTFAALLVKAGVPLIEVRDALGHSSIVVTEKHYAHLSPNRVQRAVQALRVS